MKVVFFGTAGAVQTAADSNVYHAAQGRECSLLVDASGSPVSNLKKAGIDPLELDAPVLTHSHTDHIYAVPSLIHNLWLMKRSKPLLVASNPDTSTRVLDLLKLFGLLKKEGLFRLEWIGQSEGALELPACLSVKLFPVRHSVPTCGLRVEEAGAAFVYSADTAPEERVVSLARGCRALIHEASGDSRREQYLNETGHSSARQAGEAAGRAGVDRLFLCHFDHRRGCLPADMRREAGKSYGGQVVIPRLFASYEISKA